MMASRPLMRSRRLSGSHDATKVVPERRSHLICSSLMLSPRRPEHGRIRAHGGICDCKADNCSSMIEGDGRLNLRDPMLKEPADCVLVPACGGKLGISDDG